MAEHPYIDKETLLRMVIRENELRTCENTQALYREAETSYLTDWMEVTIELQEQVVREFGIKNLQKGLYWLRTACRQYPDEPAFREIPIYVKYQRARQGHLTPGDECPNPPLYRLTGERCALLDHVQEGRPLCIFAGSYT